MVPSCNSRGFLCSVCLEFWWKRVVTQNCFFFCIFASPPAHVFVCLLRSPIHLAVTAPPFFTIPLKNEHVDLGATLTWRCISDGIPTPSYQWYRDASQLDIEKMPKEDRDRFTINSNVLTIKGVTEEDAGMYQCMAENTHGSQYSSAQLRVVCESFLFI